MVSVSTIHLANACQDALEARVLWSVRAGCLLVAEDPSLKSVQRRVHVTMEILGLDYVVALQALVMVASIAAIVTVRTGAQTATLHVPESLIMDFQSGTWTTSKVHVLNKVFVTLA